MGNDENHTQIQNGQCRHEQHASLSLYIDKLITYISIIVHSLLVLDTIPELKSTLIIMYHSWYCLLPREDKVDGDCRTIKRHFTTEHLPLTGAIDWCSNMPDSIVFDISSLASISSFSSRNVWSSRECVFTCSVWSVYLHVVLCVWC